MNKTLPSKNPSLVIFLHISVLCCLCTAACVAEYTSGVVCPPISFLFSLPLLNLIDSEAIDYK